MKDQVKICLNSQESYKCNICNDLTFILKDNEAFECECRGLREAERILQNSGISEEFRRRKFDNFDYSKNKDILNAYIMAKSYANNFEKIINSSNHSIIFMGQVGSGKTHLSLSIANYLMNKGIGVLYMSYRESVTSIKQSIMDSENYNKEEVCEELADVFTYCFQMAMKLEVNPEEIILKKLEKTKKKYPVEKAKGVSTKYNKL